MIAIVVIYNRGVLCRSVKNVNIVNPVKKPYDCSIEVQYQVLGRVVTKEEWEKEECIGFEPVIR